MAGLSVAEVACHVRLSPSTVGRIERAVAPAASVEQLARIGAAVGLDIRVRTFAGPDPLRDAGQIGLLDRLRDRLHPDLTFRTEVPLGISLDQRAWDGMIGRLRAEPPLSSDLPVEAETRLADAQAQCRRIALKMRDGESTHVLVLVADTHRNRAAVEAGGRLIREWFPISPRRALAALARGEHPGGSALVFL